LGRRQGEDCPDGASILAIILLLPAPFLAPSPALGGVPEAAGRGDRGAGQPARPRRPPTRGTSRAPPSLVFLSSPTLFSTSKITTGAAIFAESAGRDGCEQQLLRRMTRGEGGECARGGAIVKNDFDNFAGGKKSRTGDAHSLPLFAHTLFPEKIQKSFLLRTHSRLSWRARTREPGGPSWSAPSTLQRQDVRRCLPCWRPPRRWTPSPRTRCVVDFG
jgi:hypothetical protein